MEKSNLTIDIIKDPKNEITEVIMQGLREYNESKIGEYKKEIYALYAKDGEREILGGIYGWLIFGWLYIDWVWVRSDWRGKELGKEMLSSFEEFAKTRGIVNARLSTAEFQALPFYLKNGYEVYAELPCFAQNSLGEQIEFKEYFLKKSLG